MDGNDSPNISCGDSDSYNQSILTSSLNYQVDSYIVNEQGDSYQGDSFIVISETRSHVDSFVGDSYIVKARDKISDCNISYSQHSGSVNLEHGRLKNGRRAAICQLDGNQTKSSVTSYDSEDHQLPVGCEVTADSGSHIPTHWGHRPARAAPVEGRLRARHVVRRDEGLVMALSLPTISVYNMRSLWAKARSLADDITFRQTDICFLTEVWQRAESKKHKFKIEEMLEMKGIHYISTPRPNGQRGGGVAIAFPNTRFHVTKLNILIPNPLECVFALVRPADTENGKTNKFIAVCFYSPPRSKKNSQLIDLISVEISRLRSQHTGCGVIICGDRNDMRVEELMSGDPTLRQIVLQNTNKNKDKVLDIVITDLYTGYQEPVLLPAVPVDPGRPGVPSDHAGVEVRPRTNLSTSRAKIKKNSFTVQRMPASLVSGFGPVLVGEEWNCLVD